MIFVLTFSSSNANLQGRPVLSRKDVILAYTYILGREPESDAVIEEHREIESISALRDAMLNSLEFKSRQKILAFDQEKWICTKVFAEEYSVWLDLSDRYVSYGCLYDDYERSETETIKRYVRPGDRVCDLGANIGWHTLALAQAVGPNGHVDAFEPRLPTYDYLRRTVEMNALNGVVKLWNCGVWDEKGTSKLTWAPGTDNLGGSAIDKNCPGHELPDDRQSLCQRYATANSGQFLIPRPRNTCPCSRIEVTTALRSIQSRMATSSCDLAN
ncbi:MAG: Methyltransferase FkbM [Hyphomicrobiales bacterium]|nr:Methyltransferase FkbM [Hyphomicrobiales bacterium]